MDGCDKAATRCRELWRHRVPNAALAAMRLPRAGLRATRRCPRHARGAADGRRTQCCAPGGPRGGLWPRGARACSRARACPRSIERRARCNTFLLLALRPALCVRARLCARACARARVCRHLGVWSDGCDCYRARASPRALSRACTREWCHRACEVRRAGGRARGQRRRRRHSRWSGRGAPAGGERARRAASSRSGAAWRSCSARRRRSRRCLALGTARRTSRCIATGRYARDCSAPPSRGRGRCRGGALLVRVCVPCGWRRAQARTRARADALTGHARPSAHVRAGVDVPPAAVGVVHRCDVAVDARLPAAVCVRRTRGGRARRARGRAHAGAASGAVRRWRDGALHACERHRRGRCARCSDSERRQ